VQGSFSIAFQPRIDADLIEQLGHATDVALRRGSEEIALANLLALIGGNPEKHCQGKEDKRGYGTSCQCIPTCDLQ
jgi:hypothetical protein